MVLLAVLATACNAGSQAAQRTPSTAATAVGSSPAPVPVATTARPRPTRGAFTLAVAGDVHFEGAVGVRLADDPSTVFGDIAPTLRAADLALVNLETAVTERGTAVDKDYVFRAPASAFEALRAAGVDVVTNANNHGMDYGQVGLEDTLAAARAAHFPLVGSGTDEAAAYSPYVRRVRGWRVAVLGATQVLDTKVTEEWTARAGHPGLASAKRVDRLVSAVRSASRRADVVVVYLHWGVEGESCPSGDQKALARALVDAGADVVVGSHAHVVQGSGFLGRAFVGYGLGNFLFYARGEGPTSRSAVLTLTWDRGRVVKVVRTPARLQGGQTSPLLGAAGEREAARQESLRDCTDLSAR